MPTLTIALRTTCFLSLSFLLLGSLPRAASAQTNHFSVAGTTITIASGTIPWVTDDQRFLTLPDIVISETFDGAIKARAGIAIAADYQSFTAFDSSKASLKAYRVDNNADVTASIIGSNRLVNDDQASASNVADVSFQLAAPSDRSTGPIKLVISGLQAKPAYNLLGNKFVKVGGTDSSGATLDSLAKIDWNFGAGVVVSELLVAYAPCATTAIYPVSGTGCTSGPTPEPVAKGPLTSQTITLRTFTPQPSNVGVNGSVFVAAVFGNALYLMDQQQRWTPFQDCATAPAYYSGLLQTIPSIPVISTPSDLSALVGAVLLVGYGTAAADAPAGSACVFMQKNTMYNIVYTIM